MFRPRARIFLSLAHASDRWRGYGTGWHRKVHHDHRGLEPIESSAYRSACKLKGLDVQNMTWKTGHSGNPGGRPQEKAFRNALNIAVKEIDTDGKTTKLRRIADKLVACAVAGEPWAVAEVANRLDGRPHQEAALAIFVGGDPDQITDAELARIATGGSEDDDPKPETPAP